MWRGLAGVIVGYLAMFVIVFASFSVLYLALGTEGAFQPESFEVSTVWLVASIVLSLTAAVAGGWVCGAVGRSRRAVLALAGLVVLLGLATAFVSLGPPDPEAPQVRDSSLTNLEAMQNARQPTWLLFANPALGAVGVVLGGRLRLGRS